MDITLADIYDKVVVLEKKVEALTVEMRKAPAPTPEPQPIPADPWYRPTGEPPTKYLGVQMTSPDVDELVDRARYSINWRGMTCLVGEALDAAWKEVERLKTADPMSPLVQRYKTLWPDTAYLLLLTGVISPLGAAIDFGAGDAVIQVFAGVTPQQFIETQLLIVSGGGQASGNE